MAAEKPDMQAIFNEAITRDSEESRVQYLDDACENRPEVRERVGALLRAHSEAGGFFGGQWAATEIQSTSEKPGTQIGPYKLLQQIGEGGMGVVYLAEQKEPVKRRIALKIIKPGMDTRQVIARFEAERQALAMMDHPNIAKVLDAGATESGRPYFVMELVNGLPVTRYCDEQHLTPKERLELFIPICQAVQHAHQKGIIHRDLKPSNILVAIYDSQPVPKVIDFGVAKATSQTLTEETMFTQLGQVVGTLEYMSPEQAERNQLDIDTRSDIYSLGVLLYELLTGETPFDRTRIRSAAFDEMLRIIREEEPSKPSTKVSSSEMLASIAANRGIEPARLGNIIRGELDWIVLKALEKDRARRYETASKFVEDVQHYLNDEPVVACPPSVGYRFRKFAKRNSAALVAGTLVVISLLAGTGISIWQAVRASNAEQLAQRRLEEVEEQQRQTEAQRQRAEDNLQLALETLEQIYLPLAEDELSEQIELTERDRQFLQQALPFYQRLAAQKADDPQMRFVKARAYLRVGNIYLSLRTHPDEKYEPAEAVLRQAITLLQQLSGESPGKLELQQKLAQSYRSLGRSLETRRRREALQAYRTAIELYEPVLSESGSAWDYASRATCYREIKLYDEAVADYRMAIELEPNNAHFHHLLCHLYCDWPDLRLRGRLAVKTGQKAVELDSGNPTYHATLAYAYRWQGNYRAAGEACAKALRLDANHPQANRMMAEVLRRKGDFDQALAHAHKAIEAYRHRNLSAPEAYKTRGDVFIALGRHQEALSDYNDGLALQPGLAYMHRGRGNVYAAIGQHQAAMAEYAKAIQLQPNNLVLLNVTAWTIVSDPGWDTRALAQAITWIRHAVELAPEDAGTWNTLGVAHYRTGNWQEAIAALDKAETLSPGDNFGFNGFFLAMAECQLDHQDKARQWYDKAVEWTDEHLPDNEELLRFRAEAEELMGMHEQKKQSSEVSRQGANALESAATNRRASAPDPR